MQRSISLAREAEKEGWESTMLCVANDPYRIDTDMITNAKAARAYRYPIMKITNRLLSRLLPGKEILWSYLDPYYDWVPSAISVGKKLYKKWNSDLCHRNRNEQQRHSGARQPREIGAVNRG